MDTNIYRVLGSSNLVRLRRHFSNVRPYHCPWKQFLLLPTVEFDRLSRRRETSLPAYSYSIGIKNCDFLVFFFNAEKHFWCQALFSQDTFFWWSIIIFLPIALPNVEFYGSYGFVRFAFTCRVENDWIQCVKVPSTEEDATGIFIQNDYIRILKGLFVTMKFIVFYVHMEIDRWSTLVPRYIWTICHIFFAHISHIYIILWAGRFLGERWWSQLSYSSWQYQISENWKKNHYYHIIIY